MTPAAHLAVSSAVRSGRNSGRSAIHDPEHDPLVHHHHRASQPLSSSLYSYVLLAMALTLVLHGRASSGGLFFPVFSSLPVRPPRRPIVAVDRSLRPCCCSVGGCFIFFSFQVSDRHHQKESEIQQWSRDTPTNERALVGSLVGRAASRMSNATAYIIGCRNKIVVKSPRFVE